MHIDDTICAIATAAGGAARGMIRISGRRSLPIADAVFDRSGGQSLGQLKRSQSVPARALLSMSGVQRQVPCDLVVWPTNRSYTGEPVVELHTFGSRPVLESMLAAVCRAGARLAEPGEFTLRAFLAGRIDLTQAEAVLGVIDARSASDLDGALRQLAGGIARPLHELREELLQLLAELEAAFDFAEEDIEFISAAELARRIEGAAALLSDLAARMARRHVSAELPRVVLLGSPNAGKSSLFNALTQRFARPTAALSGWASPALVSPKEGTTRDYLSATVSLNGIDCRLIDTAGIDESLAAADSIASAARLLTQQQRARAMVRVHCKEAATDGRKPWESEIIMGGGNSGSDIVALTKSDLVEDSPILHERLSGLPLIVTSSLTGRGLAELACAIGQCLERNDSAERIGIVAATADRCRESIRRAFESLERSLDLLAAGNGQELVAAELRAALDEIGAVVGAVYTDDILDRVFSTFCIGK